MISSRHWRIGVRAVTLPRSSRLGRLEVAKTFVVHGIEHILFGYNRLLFVLALMLIARNWRALLLTVTAFTAAHSITLTLATLGFVNVPGPPVEAAIAFSILLLVCEIIRIHNGHTSLTAQRPRLVAFGFAGALANLALPAGDIPLALLFFNIAAVIGLVGCAGLLKFPPRVGHTPF